MASTFQLKYGARLINSYLGDNSTISCCEVLNSLLFPGHEQHHNNSFLCASTVLGQSNMAAGATIGSNHNSRGADGEIIAGRGFWPGLCVSLKHNSKFASFTLIAKGDFPKELNIPFPFSLISNEVSTDKLTVMPGYWFMYNMYALARNVGKYISRDKRMDKSQTIEYDFLAPDSVNEMFVAIELFKTSTATAWAKKHNKKIAAKDLVKTGEDLLENNSEEVSQLEILAEGFENSQRNVQLLKVAEAYQLFKKLVTYYGTVQLIHLIEQRNIVSWKKLVQSLPASPNRTQWKNIGGQLMPDTSVNSLIRSVRSGKIASWNEVHSFYHKKSSTYDAEKFQHAFASLLEVLKLSPGKFTKRIFISLLQQAVTTREWMTKSIYDSKAKDYHNPFRKMVYDTEQEMEKVTGKLKDNSFILQQQQECITFTKKAEAIIQKFS